MQILEILAPTDGKCRPCINRTGFRGVTIHNTSNWSNGANAIAHAKLLRGAWKNRTTSWNYVVDKDYAVRCVPENEVAWCQGDGNGDGNMKTISIEICDNEDGDIRKATDNAVELTADILARNGVTNINGYLWQHNHWTGKDCPYDIRRNNPYSWEEFCKKVQQKLTPPEPEPTEIQYRVHIQDKGWSKYYNLDQWAGTKHESLRIEAIQFKINNPKINIEAEVHIQDKKDWLVYKNVTNDTIIGTTGESLRLECIKLKVDGGDKYSFQLHIQDYGDTCPTRCDGASSLGSVGQSLRVEAFRMGKNLKK